MPTCVKNPPDNFAELKEWAKKNPKQFGYNGIKGGMSGVAFVAGWVYAFGGDADKLIKGPYDAAEKAELGHSASPSSRTSTRTSSSRPAMPARSTC